MVDDSILKPDNCIYQDLKGLDQTGTVGAFRDPFIFPTKEGYSMVFSARDMNKDLPYNGCIGLATSTNLVNWTLQEPLISPGITSEMEVPQLINLLDGRTLLLASANPEKIRSKYKSHYPLLTYISDSSKDFQPFGIGYTTGLPDSVYSIRCLSVNGKKIKVIAFYNGGRLDGSITPTFELEIGNSLTASIDSI